MMKDIEIKISRETRMVDLSKTTIGNDGENLQGNLVFSFTDEFVKGQGRLEYIINGESKYAFLLNGDENYYIPIKSVMTKEGQIDMQLVITEGTDVNEIPIFKSNVFYVSCKKSINAEVEEEEGYYSWIEIANTKLNEVDEAIEELASQSNYAKEQGDYAKEQGTNAKNVADDTQKKAEEGKFNGKSLEFVWQGTKLGIRLEGQEEYQFVDLQGVQGEIGATGEPFKIKKTYASISEMNADFRNMEFGDYVMIASSVEVEDNAKLYTRGESAWIFISDFSGAMGIRGETGLTPNIKIGEVKTLEAGSQAKVTRSGSNEEPVFNFELPKGDKGDDYVLTEEDKVEIGEKVNTEYEQRIEQNEKYISELEATIDILTNTDTKKGELVHITDALPLPVFKTTADGNAKQFTTTGTNLCDLNVTQNDKVVYNSDGTITINGSGGFTLAFKQFTAKANTKYYIKWELVSGTVDTSKSNGNSFLNPFDNTNIKQDEFKENVIKNDKNISGFWINNMAVFTNAVIRIWFSETQIPFEPYTGGQASPNPEYPQEIEILEGYNLFDKNNANVIDGYISGSSATKIEASSYGKIIYIKCEPNTSYSISKLANRFFMASSSEIPQVDKYIENVVNSGDTLTEYNNYVTSATAKYLILYCYYSKNASFSFEEMLDSIQIIKGKKVKPYLPYGCVEYKVNGKNFFKNEPSSLTIHGLTMTNDGETITIKGTNTSSSFYPSFIFYADGSVEVNDWYPTKNSIKNSKGYFTNGKNTHNLSIIKNGTMDKERITIVKSSESSHMEMAFYKEKDDFKHKIATDEKVNFIAICFLPGQTVDLTFKVQIDLGDKATDYEPYKEQIVYLDLKGNFVGAINDTIKDYLVTDKKKYWLVKNVGKYVFTGDENNLVLRATYNNINQFELRNYAGFYEQYNAINIISSHYKGIAFMSNTGNSWTIDNTITIIADGNIVIMTSQFTTVEEFKAYLKEQYNNGTPVVAYYRPKTAEIIELGKLPEPIKTFEGTNNIQLLANLDTEIEVKYALDVKKYFENKLAEISAQII